MSLVEYRNSPRVQQMSAPAGANAAESPPSPRYHRRFHHRDVDGIAAIEAEKELEGWSLLGRRGPPLYLGPEEVIAEQRGRLPQNMDEVDEWIDRAAPREEA